jgi:hypothetical protein
VGAHVRPIGAPPPGPVKSDSYRYVRLQADKKTPVAYDPCRPIHYVTRPQSAPADGQKLITEAIARVSAATGLVFTDDGPTAEGPDQQRNPFQPERYGDRWAPVLISWVTADENPDVAEDVAGLGGSYPMGLNGTPVVFVTGRIELDADQLAQVIKRPQGSELARAIILHELGHLVGLAHVNDKTQIMYPQTIPGVVDFGDGDLAGLSALGRGACVPAL